MESLILRIILTAAGFISILIDCYKETVINNDGRIYIITDIYKIIMMITIWFI